MWLFFLPNNNYSNPISIKSYQYLGRGIMREFPKDLNRVAIYLRKSRADIEAEMRGEGETLSKHKKALWSLHTGTDTIS